MEVAEESMANAILLDTRTSSFLELIGNGKVYRVPPYQRDYSWQEEQWEDLWNDILDLRKDSNQRHYMGTLVIESLTDREFQIIDGQQRMATLSLLSLAVIKRLEQLANEGHEEAANKERANALRHRFVGEKDPASLIESSKLFLNETDNPFYQDFLVQLKDPINPRGLLRSNKLLWQCFQFFLGKLTGFRESSDGKALASLLNDTMARQLLFIVITVDDDLNAYTVFETLNARGLALSATDLLKNFLFSRVRVASDLEVLQRRWQRLVAAVRQERFPEFLRYHLLCHHPQVRRQRLFKIVRNQVRDARDVFTLMDALEGRAELFAALLDGSHDYWVEKREAQPWIHELVLFGSRQLTPILFAAWSRFGDRDFARTVKLISRFVFRYTVVCSLNTNALEPVSHEIAHGILEGDIEGPQGVFDALRPRFVDDKKFIQDFSVWTINTSGRRRRIAKYVLCRLEGDLCGRPCDPDTDPATIEHILPTNPSEVWADEFPEEKWGELAYRLGNLTLLEPSLNRNAGNRSYEEKVDDYKKSRYGLTKEVVKLAPESWTPQLLDRRQQILAKRAAHLWRSDFDGAS